MAGLTFDGVTSVHTAGGSVSMLEFSMTSLALSGNVVLTVSQNGGTLRTQASSATFSGSVVLYTTAISFSISGTQVSYTTASPPSSLPSDAQVAGLLADQLYLAADLAQVSGLLTTIPSS
jgi:hypothetical protein